MATIQRKLSKTIYFIKLRQKQIFIAKNSTQNNGINNVDNPILVCNEEHRFIVAEQIREINIKKFSILLEPVGRNTAPAITIAALKAIERETNPTLLVLASDHEIENTKAFIDTIELGKEYAEQDKIVCFGIIPTSPETGYGYIKTFNPLSNDIPKGEKNRTILEKPNLQKAKELIKNKRFSWNSGIFMVKAKVLLKEMENFLLKY